MAAGGDNFVKKLKDLSPTSVSIQSLSKWYLPTLPVPLPFFGLLLIVLSLPSPQSPRIPQDDFQLQACTESGGHMAARSPKNHPWTQNHISLPRKWRDSAEPQKGLAFYRRIRQGFLLVSCSYTAWWRAACRKKNQKIELLLSDGADRVCLSS